MNKKILNHLQVFDNLSYKQKQQKGTKTKKAKKRINKGGLRRHLSINQQTNLEVKLG